MYAFDYIKVSQKNIVNGAGFDEKNIGFFELIGRGSLGTILVKTGRKFARFWGRDYPPPLKEFFFAV